MIHPHSLLNTLCVQNCLRQFPEAPTSADASFKAQLEVMLQMGSMLHAYVIQRGIYCPRAPLPADVPPGPMGGCYRTAAELALEHPDRFVYVEGYALSVIPIQHAWCIEHDGTVVDPTWPDIEQHAYYGVPFATQFLQEHLENSTHWGVFGEMPRRDVLRTPLDRMVHPRWLPHILGRPKLPEVEKVLSI